MIRQPGKYKYAQLEIYKEDLELKHLKRKTIIVNTIILLSALLVLFFLIEINYSLMKILPIMFMFFMLLLLNLAYYSYDHDHYNSLKIAMYITTLGVYCISIVLIFMFPTPSVFTSIFLAYAIASIYQDYKSMLISNFALFISGSAFVLSFPDTFDIVGIQNPQQPVVLIFLIVFVLLLTLSSYILIKRKNFFYNQLAQIKESEIRNIILYNEIESIKDGKAFDSEVYYDSLKKFSDALSEKIGVEDIFSRKIQLLKDIKSLKPKDVLEKYPEYTETEIGEISNMELEVHYKMRMLGLKSSQSKGIEVSRKEIFSESQFKSFKHFGDSRYAKIISFVVFYCLLKLDKPYLAALEEDKIKDIFLNSEYFYRVDKEIINIYLENNEVFDAIVKDHLEGSW